jgi:hypothetical protein
MWMRNPEHRCSHSRCKVGRAASPVAFRGLKVYLSSVLGVDVDTDALQMARENIGDIEDVEDVIELLEADVSSLAPFATSGQSTSLDSSTPTPTPTTLLPRAFDTVIMNPPFGTKTKGLDMVFLQQACSARRRPAPAVWSLFADNCGNIDIEASRLLSSQDEHARLHCPPSKKLGLRGQCGGRDASASGCSFFLRECVSNVHAI